MLRLKNVTKDYESGGGTVHALSGVSVDFRESEFVAILGPSGCGKTTLLNIIGGLDRFTDGDLIVDGTSTKDFGSREWDAYRNHSVGFVFQSYNLIPHLDALANVEMALKVSGESKTERRAKAEAALEQVGLGDQIHKRPAQMSGGQMQRVAIARALVNDPKIVLADEPTGALDSDTSIQVMEILKSVAQDRLVVMVTHNPELAEEYATRIIRLKDGLIQSDSNPPDPKKLPKEEGATFGRSKLGFLTAMGLSAKNLMTKKGRTILTSFAGAIGIIGIALILALSSGMNDYIAGVEQDTMGVYPIELEAETVDTSQMMGSGGDTSLLGVTESSDTSEDGTEDQGGIRSENVVADAVEAEQQSRIVNNLALFKDYLEGNESKLEGSISAVEYGYDVSPLIMREDATQDSDDESSAPITVSPSSLDTGSEDAATSMTMSAGGMGMMGGSSSQASSTWQQLPENDQLIETNYDLLAGTLPEGANEAALVVDGNGQVSDYVLYTLGILDMDEMEALVEAVENGEEYQDEQAFVSYDDALGLTFKVLCSSDVYAQDDEGIWYDASDDEDHMAAAYEAAPDITITAVLMSTEDASIQSGVAYTGDLTKSLMDRAAESEVVQQQLADPETNVLTGEPFDDEDSEDSTDNEDESTTEEDSSDDAASTQAVSYDTGLNSSSSADAASFTQASYSSGGQTTVVSTASMGASSAAGTSGSTMLLTDSGSSGEGSTLVKVSFVNYDGEVLLESEVESGTVPVFEGDVPVRPDADGKRYTFLGWQDESTGALYLASSPLPEANTSVVYQAYYQESAIQGGGSGENPGGSGQTPDNPGGGSQGSTGQMPDMSGYGQSSSPSAGLSASGQMSAMGSAGMTAGAQSSMALLGSSVPDTYEDVLSTLGYAVADDPDSISLYPSDFDGKTAIEDFIEEYNAQAGEGESVTYTDMVSMMTSSISSIVDIISAILIAFVAISLVVSSIMIAIITYISVLERKKEIGILRAIGASKGDISKVFNAETVIEGLLAGIVGVGAALLICIPANAVIGSMFGVENLAALPVSYGVLLVGISVLLTFVAGFIPARMASRKDPVVALRGE